MTVSSYFSSRKSKRWFSRNGLKYSSAGLASAGAAFHLANISGALSISTLALPYTYLFLGAAAIVAGISKYRASKKRKILTDYLRGNGPKNVSIYVKGKDLLKVGSYEDINILKHHTYKIHLNNDGFDIIDEENNIHSSYDFFSINRVEDKMESYVGKKQSLNDILDKHLRKITEETIKREKYENAKRELKDIESILNDEDWEANFANNTLKMLGLLPEMYRNLMILNKFGDEEYRTRSSELMDNLVDKIEYAKDNIDYLDIIHKQVPDFDSKSDDEKLRITLQFARELDGILELYNRMYENGREGDKERIKGLIDKLKSV